MAPGYISISPCLWYSNNCCPETKCNGRGRIRLKGKSDIGNLVQKTSHCESFWPITNKKYSIREQSREAS
jgi:hypothetical protein